MTLAETQQNMKKWAAYLAVAIIVFYGGRFVLRGGYSVIKMIWPDKPDAPIAGFGILPKLNLTSIKIEGNPEYILELPNSKMPNFPDRQNVYEISEPLPNFLAEQDMKNLAEEMQFSSSYVKVDDATFKWTDGNRARTLNANIVKRDFALETNSERLTTIANNNTTISNLDAETKVIQFIKSNNLMAGIDAGNIFTTSVVSDIFIGKIRESRTTTDRSKLIKVNVYRNIVEGDNKFPVLGRNPRDSMVSFYVTNAEEPENFPIINYIYWPVNYGDSGKSEYSLSPITAVWQTIQQGNGVISYLRTENSDYYDPLQAVKVSKVEIRDVYMAYYEQREYSPFLQPIYVFEGVITTAPEAGKISETGSIVIYYPAVSGEHVQ